jgi:hypothetical protein
MRLSGLLIGIRHLSMAGVPRDQLRPARILLTACGAATLALNIAGPVTAGAYGRAAFDSVGPGLSDPDQNQPHVPCAPLASIVQPV